MRKGFVVLVFFAMAGAAAGDIADSADTVLIHLDGYNSIAVVHQTPFRSRATPWFTTGTVGRGTDPDGLLSKPWAASDAPLGSVTARLGSETGDPLLNKIDNPHLPNRDHEIECWAGIRIPQVSTALWGAYRYTDIWSDRFDTLWARHRETMGAPMAGTGPDEADGLSDEKVVGYTIAPPNSRTDGYVLHYSHWGATPYYHAPVRSTGTMTHHRSRVTIGERFACRAEVLLDWQERYLDHVTGSDFASSIVDAEATYGFTAHAEVGVRVRHDSRYAPASRMIISLRAADLGPFTTGFDIGTWDNGQPFGAIALTVRVVDNISLAVRSAWDYEPALESVRFTHLDTVVNCTDTPRRGVGIHAGLAYHDTLAFPLRASFWYDFRDTPYLLSHAPAHDGSVGLRYVPAPGGPATTLGCNAHYEITAGIVNARLRVAAHTLLDGGLEALSVPWDAGLDLGVHSRRRPDLQCAVSLDAVGPVEQRYLSLPDNTIERFRSDSRVVLGVHGRLPLLMPILRNRLRAALELSVTNINLTGDIRTRSHPQGNLIGPTIRVNGIGALLTEPRRSRAEREP